MTAEYLLLKSYRTVADKTNILLTTFVQLYNKLQIFFHAIVNSNVSTHRGLEVSENVVIIGLGNGLSYVRQQAIKSRLTYCKLGR